MLRRTICAFFFLVVATSPIIVGAATYYVSSASGSDAADGLTPATAFATASHVNGLALQPGDEVRFLCGETWRADPLVVTRSGSAAMPIVFSSHPASCVDKPVLSGARGIAGWAVHAGNVLVADLGAGANAGLFPNGVNQLFRSGSRLPFGRWPNLAGHPDGGYSEIDGQPSNPQITDAELPAGNWNGAVAHIKGIRWYIINRVVTATAGNYSDARCQRRMLGRLHGLGLLAVESSRHSRRRGRVVLRRRIQPGLSLYDRRSSDERRDRGFRRPDR